MSWNKNTINMSEIDRIESVLIILKEPYRIVNMGTVIGNGMNDGPEQTHNIRKLYFRDKVVIDRMERSYDCDMDDCIVSYVMEKDKEPKVWHKEVFLHDSDFDCYENCSCKVDPKSSQQLELF